jgi:hypothetical protein
MIDQLVYDMETDILARIAYYLSRGAVASADWQTRKLAQLGALTRDAQAIINQYRARILLQTGKAVTESAEDILAKIRARTPKQLKTIAAMTPEMRAIIETWSGSAATKVNLAMAQLAQNAGTKYVAAVSKASLSVVTGTETLQRSVFQAIGELERLDAFVDKAGRTWTPEGYVKMVVRDNQRRASTATMFQAAAEGETDLIEVSSHLGARPKCAPYQGRIFSISGRSKKYPALADTSFGQVDGLNGINCGHIFYPYFEGVSTKTYEPYPAKENKEAYAQSQEQRAAERKIRYYKREAQKWGATEGGEQKAAYFNTRVKESQAEMREFIKETGRTRQRDREAIYG